MSNPIPVYNCYPAPCGWWSTCQELTNNHVKGCEKCREKTTASRNGHAGARLERNTLDSYLMMGRKMKGN